MQTKKLVRVSSKGQIVLPKGLRDSMCLQTGDYIMIEELPDGHAIMGRQEESPLDSIVSGLRRAAKEKNFTRKDLEDAIQEVRKRKSAQ